MELHTGMTLTTPCTRRRRAAQALAVAASIGWLVAPPAAARPKGEEWDYALTMEIEGTKVPLPPVNVCVLPDEGHTPEVDVHCTLKDKKTAGETTRFHIVCGPPDPGEMKGSFTRNGDRVEGRYTMKQDGDTMTVLTVGRKLGACDPSKPALPARRK